MRLLLKRIVLFLGYILHYNHDSKVIYYHDVSKKYTDMGTDYELIRRHIDIIHNMGYEIVPEISSRKYQVMICFDDGWSGIYDYVDEFLKFQIYPTIFIAVDLVGKNGYLNESQIKEMQKNGFRFQAHTWSHKDLTNYDENGLKHELKDSKDWLEKEFGHSFDSVCFPMGRFSKLVKEKSLRFGYSQLFSSIPGGYYDFEKEKLICRNCAQKTSEREFKWMLNGNSIIFRKKLIKQQIDQ